MKRFLSTCFGIAAFLSLSAQCSVVEVPLVQRVNASSLIVEGRVTGQYSYWNSNHSMIYTANVVEIYKIFKGNVNTTSIEVLTEGGTVGMDRITVEPVLELSVGETGMFTLGPLTRVHDNVVSRNTLPQYEAYASLQGFVKYNQDMHSATDHFRTYNDIQAELYSVCGTRYREVKELPVANSTQRNGGPQVMAGPDVQGFAPGTVTAGTGTVLTITGESFGMTQGSGFVQFPNADDGGATFIQPLPSQYIFWDDNTIKVEVPQNAGTGFFEVSQGGIGTSPSSLTISYAHLNVDFDPGPGVIAYQTDHIDDNGSGGYTWRMNTGFAGNAPASAAFTRAFDSWRCATGVNWTIGANTSINDAVSDGTNIICFDNTAPLSAGILGVCFSYWSGCASGPTIIWYVNELDIIFDEGSNITPLTWEFGPSAPTINEYDFETVAVHELGHGHQLGHVIEPGAIMHFAISNGSANRSLDPNDLAGGSFVQSKSVVTNVCGPGAMSNFSCAAPPVAAFTVNDQTICEGQSVSFTDQSTGSPTTFQWTFTGGTPSSSTLQNPNVTYSTPGVYDVTLVATNASGSDSETMVGYITVSANPTVGFSVSPGLVICQGQSITLSGTGATSYGWSGGITNGVPFSPSSSNTYTVTGTNAAGCTGTASAGVTVNSAPSLSIVSNPSNGIVCSGNQATLTASGAQSYGWTGGITNGVPFTPPGTITYTVTGTAANGCTATATQLITVQSCNFQTQLTSSYCGAGGLTMNSTIAATTVSGATNYEFLFVNTSLGYSQSRVKGNGIPTLPLTWVSGLQYGQQYQVQVRAYVNNAWQAYGVVCNIWMATNIPTPQLTNCAMTNLTLQSMLGVTQVPGAQDYEYEVTNAQQPLSTTRLRGGPTTTITLSWFQGIQYGRTYNCRVRAKVGGVWGNYGPSCTFTMQAHPTNQLTTSCGATNLTTSSLLTYGSVYGATNYRVNITNTALGYNVTKVRGNSLTTISLANWTGLTNATYTVTVASYIGGAWGPFGPACTITIGPLARLDGSQEEEVPNASFNFGLSMYPNPVMNGVNPTITINGADQKEASVTIMDLSGRTITSYTLFVQGDVYTTELAGFPDLIAGMYLMQVQIGDQIQTQRFVAE